MPKIQYAEKRFQLTSRKLIRKSNEIIEKYADQGFDLTLRQLFYQLVTIDFFHNTQQNYKRLGSLINDARMAGLIDWSRIVDITRFLRSSSHWNNPDEIIKSAASSFRLDKWASQQYRPEVWIEKDALIGVIDSICNPLDVPCMSCRGYSSVSEVWRSAQRLLGYIHAGQKPVIIHLGDHDPSGIDMTRDIEERLSVLSGEEIRIERIALNMDQVRLYNPPPNTAKETDSRWPRYVKTYGKQSWELDALPPTVLRDLITKAVESVRDNEKWSTEVGKETRMRAQLNAASVRWPIIEKWIGNRT